MWSGEAGGHVNGPTCFAGTPVADQGGSDPCSGLACTAGDLELPEKKHHKRQNQDTFGYRSRF